MGHRGSRKRSPKPEPRARSAASGSRICSPACSPRAVRFESSTRVAAGSTSTTSPTSSKPPGFDRFNGGPSRGPPKAPRTLVAPRRSCGAPRTLLNRAEGFGGALDVAWGDPEEAAEAAGAGTDRLTRDHVDLRGGELAVHLGHHAHPILAVEHEDLPRAGHLPAGLPGHRPERGRILGDEVDLRASPGGKSGDGDQVDPGLAERGQRPLALAGLVGRLDVAVVGDANARLHDGSPLASVVGDVGGSDSTPAPRGGP